jgi:alkylation response protein AidB-like acyl-CoA dehydrogenase
VDLSLSGEQNLLKSEARRFLADKLPATALKELEDSNAGYSPEMWEQMVELGWMALPFPEEYGGAGMGFLDLAVLLEEMGRACFPGPYFSTIVLGGLPILDVGSEKQKQEYIPKIAKGEALFTLALTEPSARYDAAAIRLSAARDGEGYILNGAKLFVPYAHMADHMIVVARTSESAKAEEGVTIFIVDSRSLGITCTVLKTIDNDKLCEVVFDRVRVDRQSILGQLGEGWGEAQNIIGRAAAAKCCEMVGGMQKVLDMTVEYAKKRVQYGRPIGNFQVIQHYCADMATDVDGSRFVAYQTAWMINEGLNCDREIAIAKAWTNEAYNRVVSMAHQIHGAIGFTKEYDLRFYSRRAGAASAAFGDTDFHHLFLARKMGLHDYLSV